LNTAECITSTGAAGNAACSNGTIFKRDAQDAYAIAARVRLAF
jgi:hypothetical protein